MVLLGWGIDVRYSYGEEVFFQWRIDEGCPYSGKQQYKVCAKFYKILKSLHEDSRMMYQRFYESFELIDPDGLEEYFVELHWAINDMDNALYETDTYTPMKFFEIAGKLSPMIK